MADAPDWVREHLDTQEENQVIGALPITIYEASTHFDDHRRDRQIRFVTDQRKYTAVAIRLLRLGWQSMGTTSEGPRVDATWTKKADRG